MRPTKSPFQFVVFFLCFVLARPISAEPTHPSTLRPVNAGMEEAPVQQQLESTLKTGLEEEWKELDYHLHRLQTGDATAQIMAAQAIDQGLIQRPEFTRTDQLITQLLRGYSSTSEPFLRAELLGTMVYAGFHRPEIRQILTEVIRNPHEELHLLRGVIYGLTRAIFHHRLSAFKNEVAQLTDPLISLLMHPDESIVIWVLQLINDLTGFPGFDRPSKPREVYVKREDLKKSKLWPQVRIQIQHHHLSSPKVRVAVAKLLFWLGEEVQLGEIVLNPSRDSVSRLNEIGIAYLIQRASPKRVLSSDEMDALFLEIQREGDLPRNLLRAFLEEGSRVLFVMSASTDISQYLREGIVQDALFLADLAIPLTHFAISISPSRKEELEEFLNGSDSHGFLKYLAEDVFHFLPKEWDLGEENNSEFEASKEVFRDQLNQLRGHVEFVLFGARSDFSGENVFDSWLYNLNQALNNPNARLLVYHYFDEEGFSERAWLTRDLPGKRSLIVALEEEIGKGKVSTLREASERVWIDEGEEGFFGPPVHNLDKFLGRYPVASSFGLRLGKSSLDRLLFDNDFEIGFAQAYDGILFRKERGEEDPDFFTMPKLPKPEVLVPSGGPIGSSLLVGTGLEEYSVERDLAQLSEAAQGAGVLVIGPEAVEVHAGLEELVRRAPPELLRRMIFFGMGQTIVQRLKEVNPQVKVVPENDLVSLWTLLLSMPQADRVTVLGSSVLAQQLQRMAPPSIFITRLDPRAALRLILAALGVPDSVLDQIDLVGLEEQLTRQQSA